MKSEYAVCHYQRTRAIKEGSCTFNMNYLTFNGLLAVSWLLWEQATTNSCETPNFEVQGHVLTNHVTWSFPGTSTSENCFHKCAGNPTCHSFNWFSEKGLCELNNGTHLTSPEDLLFKSTEALYILYKLRPTKYCSNRYCSDGQICKAKNNGISYECRDCNTAIGAENKDILEDSRFTASSALWGARCGRLNFRDKVGGWVAKVLNDQWFQVDMGQRFIVQSIASQGAKSKNMWTKKYRLKWKNSDGDLDWYKYGGVVMDFTANTGSGDAIVLNHLPFPIKTRLVRFIIVEYYGTPAIRVELYGCKD